MTMWTRLTAYGKCILASAIDAGGAPDGGGLFALTGERAHVLSRQNITGLDVTDGHLRVLAYSDREDHGAMMHVYDTRGLRAAYRLDGVVKGTTSVDTRIAPLSSPPPRTRSSGSTTRERSSGAGAHRASVTAGT